MKKEIHEILQQVMDEKDMSVADIARACGLSDSTVRAIMRRKSKTVALEVAFKLAAGLNMDIDCLYGEEAELNESATGEKPAAEKDEGLSKTKREFIEFIDTLDDEQIKRVRELVETALRLNEK